MFLDICDLPHLSPHLSLQCLKQVVHAHHRAMDNLANKQKAIFITNILNDMHADSFSKAHSSRTF